jgi:hypothetical protein
VQGLATLAPLIEEGSGVPLSDAQPAMELAAQLHYRQGSVQQCTALYATLLQKHKARFSQ